MPLDRLEAETVAWCREMLALSPFALRLVKASFNAHEDGYAGIQQLAHDTNLLFYGSEEAREGREAFKEKRAAGLLAVPEASMTMQAKDRQGRRHEDLGDGGAAADAAGGDSSGAGRHRGSSRMARRGCRGVGAFIAALIGSIFIQIGTNLANDYSDARRGADTADRLGPVRVTSAGLVTPRRVLNATWIAFGVAVACGIYLAAVAGIVIILIGALSIAAGVLYTGGPRPYGYAGLGEVFVFLFFGLVAVNGSYYVQLEQLDALPLGLSIAVGFIATAILVVNNVRDLETDRRAGKMTLAVRMGRHNAVVLYRGLVLGAFVVLPIALLAGGGSWLPLIGLLALPMAVGPMRAMTNRTDGPALNGALAGTGALLAVFSLLVSVGLLLAGDELMRLASVEVIPYALPFREPYVTARGRLERREMVLLRLRSDEAWSAWAKPCRSRCAAARRWPGRRRAGGSGET